MFALPVPDYAKIPKFKQLQDEIDNQARAEALDFFLPHFRNRYLRALSSPQLAYDARIGAGNEILRNLQRDGCAMIRINAPDKARLVELTRPLISALEAARQDTALPHFKDGQLVCDREEHAAAFELIDSIFSTEHIYEVSSAYSAKPLTLKALAIQINDERTTALRYGQLDDEGLPSPRTRYYHIDSASWPPLKVLIYLNRVTRDEGPFRYVIGSHRLADPFELAVRKTNDKLKISRKLFLALPAPFRAHADFGDFMDPEGEEALALLDNEREMCDGASDMILFDFNGVHRGGFVRHGHRHMLQCVFEPRT